MAIIKLKNKKQFNIYFLVLGVFWLIFWLPSYFKENNFEGILKYVLFPILIIGWSLIKLVEKEKNK